MREIKFREWETERETMVVGVREEYDDSVLHMANMGVTYEERNVDENEAYMQEALDTGYKSMPIVVLNGEVIASGFQPDRLDELEGSN